MYLINLLFTLHALWRLNVETTIFTLKVFKIFKTNRCKIILGLERHSLKQFE